MSFWGELKRRSVLKVAIAYAVVTWLLIQVAVTIEEPLGLPAWTDTLVIVLLGIGFPVALLLAWAFELTPEGIKRTDAHEAQTASPSSAGAPVATEPRPRGEPLPNSIAVLPLANLSPDPGNAWFAAGLHEEILNQLAKLSRLNVIARTSVLQYAGSELPISEIAGALNVRSVMEGSIRYAGNRIRVTTQLINAETGSHLWSETYDREFSDVFAIESEIAMSVAKALAVELTPDEKEAIQRIPTTSPEAYALYLQGVGNIGGGSGRTLHLLERALEFDPRFAAAHQAKAMVHGQALVNSTVTNAIGPEERQHQVELACHHAACAARIDPSLAWLEKTVVALFTWHWREALSVLDQAPDPIDYSSVLLYSYGGRHDKAIARAQRAVELSPGDVMSMFPLSLAYAYAGRMGESLRAFNEVIEIAPTLAVLRSWRAFVDIALGDTAAAALDLEHTEQLLDDNRQIVFLPELAYSYSRIGRTQDVERILAEIEKISADAVIGAGGEAMLCLARGDRAGLIESLETAIGKMSRYEIDEGLFSLMNIRFNVTADPLLEEPDIAALRGRLRGN